MIGTSTRIFHEFGIVIERKVPDCTNRFSERMPLFSYFRTSSDKDDISHVFYGLDRIEISRINLALTIAEFREDYG